MHDLKVIGVEDGALIAATESGERFRLLIDDVLQSHVRRSRQDPSTAPKISPRDVQAHIRSGLSADEVAKLTGADVEYIQRFEGPVLAEREHIVGAALAVQVLTAIEPTTDDDDSSFGAAIRARLESLGATDERWTSWKEAGGGWTVKLSFTAANIDHDARWSFEPKKAALAPLNSEAVTLSKQGELPTVLIPRLRAVDRDDAHPDDSRFDSGAFNFRDAGDNSDFSPHIEIVARPQSSSKEAAAAAINREEAPGSQSNQTADLLEALRKRRGERESAHRPDEDSPSTSPRLVDVPLDFDTLGDSSPEPPSASSGISGGAGASSVSPTGSRQKRGRTAMPSWDEIVFGARTDED
ncbi:MAG: septation protein SepH [Mycetocola sp.]